MSAGAAAGGLLLDTHSFEEAARRSVDVLLPSWVGSSMQELSMVHDRVREEMRVVLASADRPAFVDATGLDLLTEARATYFRLGLTAPP